jgi:hypothetical protein
VRKSKFAFLFLVAFVCTTASSAFADKEGHGSGNGGGFVVCKDLQSDTVESIELADLYYGRTQLNFTYQKMEERSVYSAKDSLDFSRDLVNESVFSTLRSFLPGKMWDLFKSLYNQGCPNRNFTSEKIEYTHDVKEVILKALKLPENCYFYQAANFHDEPNKLELNDYLSDPLFVDFIQEHYKVTGKDSVLRLMFFLFNEPLLIHEYYYRLARARAEDQDSLRTMTTLAYIYADLPNFIYGNREDQRAYDKLVKDLKKLTHGLWAQKPFVAPGSEPISAQTTETR